MFYFIYYLFGDKSKGIDFIVHHNLYIVQFSDMTAATQDLEHDVSASVFALTHIERIFSPLGNLILVFLCLVFDC